MGSRRRQVIDLSLPLMNHSFEPQSASIVYATHREIARRHSNAFGFALADFPDGVAGAMETVTVGTHVGTHMDAPWHYGPTCEGQRAKTIDEIPLEWCVGDGVVLDLTAKRAGEVISAAEVRGALKKIGYTLKPWDIVLVRTDAARHYEAPGFNERHPGVSREATFWLIDQGVKVMGIDAFSWDIPRSAMIAGYRKGDRGALWPAHFAGREREYLQVEKLANLDRIPVPFGFTVAVFPIKIERASGAWCRAVAIVDG